MQRLTVAVIFACAIGSTSAHAVLIRAHADLDYGQEVNPSNPTPSNATGTADLVFDTIAGTLNIAATITGIFLPDVTFPGGGLAFGALGPFHIHEAPAGANGPIVVPFNQASFFTGTATGLNITASGVSFDPTLLAALLGGELYLNLHSRDYGSGEIRGQIQAVLEPQAVGLVAFGLIALWLTWRRPRT